MQIFSATILVSKTDGIAPSLLLTCFTKSNPSQEVQYIFNLPESLIRLAASHGLRLSRISAIFIPEINTESTGGFCSAFLGQSSGGSNSLKFIAPNGFDKIVKGFASLNGRFARTDIKCVSSTAPESVFSDDCIEVCALHDASKTAVVPLWLTNGVVDLLSDDESSSSKTKPCQDVIEISSDSSSDVEVEDKKVNRKRKRESKNNQSKHQKKMIDGKIQNMLIKSDSKLKFNSLSCFIIHLKSTDEILVVLRITSKDTLQALIRHPLWSYLRYPQKRIKTVFHLSTDDLMKTALYKKWMLSLDGKHVVMDEGKGEDNGLEAGLIKVLDRSLRLRVIAQNYFPLPFNPIKREEQNLEPQGPKESGSLISRASLLTQVVLSDNKSEVQVLDSPVELIFPEAFISDLLRFNAHLRRLVQTLKERLDLDDPWRPYLPFFNNDGNLKSFAMQTHSSRLYPVDPTFNLTPSLSIRQLAPKSIVQMALKRDPSYLIFLGTGCAQPSSWRGSSAILVVISANQKLILLDCGEGTLGQIVRYYGAQKAKKMVNRLSCIWISHQHIDHCAGIPAILSARDQSARPVSIFAPRSVLRWLRTLSSASSMKFTFSDFGTMNQNRQLKQELQITNWQSIRVIHSVPSYGIRIDFTDGFSLVYSGDTEPCEELMRVGLNCTCLIHESTHAICDGHHARKTKHSTWNEALEVGRRMNAFRTILTHFSRRYPCLPDGLTAKELGLSALVAFDGMKVPLTHLPFLPFLNVGVEEVLREIEFGGDLGSSDDEACVSSDDE